MLKLKISNFLIITATILILLPASVTFAESIQDRFGTNYEVIVLTPGHSRSIIYELPDIILNDLGAFQATFLMTLGAGTLNVGVARMSDIGEGAELIYATTGFIGLTPVLNWAYSSGNIAITAEDLPAFTVGLLLTSVIAGIGNPDFPVGMSMTFSLY
jgi:hypothetical protein